ncbi:unnamed protein product, partial [Adineta steineri]
QSGTEDIRLFRMSKINGWQFQCANTTCLPFVTIVVSNMIKCQTNCLAQIHCRAVTFHKSISTCQLFDDIINQNSNMLANTDTISATVILQTRIPPEPTTTSTTSTSTTSTTTTTTTTTSSTSTTTSSTSTSSTTSTTTTTTSTTTSKTTITTTTTTTTTTSSSHNQFSSSQTIDGRIITCNSVNNTNLYTECSTLQQGGVYFPRGVESFLKGCEKISIVNSIKNRGGQIGNYQFYFPQHHKNHKDTINYSIGHVNELNLTENDIEIIIKNAFEAAQKYVAMVNMTQFLEKKSIHYQIIDYTVDNNSSDEDSDEENCSDENDAFNVLNNEEQLSPNNTDDEEEGNTMATDVPDTAQKKFNGCRIYDKINPQQSKKYFRIRMGSSYKFIHKQTACWLLTTDKQRSSSDLLLCVQQ